MTCAFTYAHYREIIELAKKRGYEFRLFEDAQNPFRTILMRHDIDLSLPAALRLAEIEAELGIKSTYFPMLRNASYNLLAPHQKRIMEKILSYGHEIGLHFDEKAYGANDEIHELVAREADLLTREFHRPKAVSFHQPSPGVIEGDLQFNGLINTYSKRDLPRFNYTSDSCSHWRQGCLCGLLTGGEYERLHVAIHAVWWTEKQETIDERWNRAYYDNLGVMEGQFLERESTYTERRSFDVSRKD